MYSVLGNHKTMTHRYTVNVIHIYRGIIVFTQQVWYALPNYVHQGMLFSASQSHGSRGARAD